MKRETRPQSLKRAKRIVLLWISVFAIVGTLFTTDALAQAKKELGSLVDALSVPAAISANQENTANATSSSVATAAPGDSPNGTSADNFETTPDALTYDPVTRTVTISGNCTTDQMFDFVHEGGAGENVKYVHFSGASTIQTLIPVPDDPDDPQPFVGVGPFFEKYDIEGITADPNASVSFVGKNSRLAPVLTSFFNDCSSLANIDGLSVWDVSNVTGPFCMQHMFAGCLNLASLDALAFWNVSKVNGDACMQSMFQYCESLTSLSGISSWDVSNVAGAKCMQNAFHACTQLTSLDALASWNIGGALASTDGVSDMFWTDTNIASLVVNPESGFILDESMRLPTASWWPTQGSATSFSTTAMIAQSSDTAQYGNRWYVGNSNPYIRDAEPEVSWPVTSKNYTGFNQTIDPASVKVGTTTLKEGVDYTVSYRYATTEAGDTNDSVNTTSSVQSSSVERNGNANTGDAYPVVHDAGTYSASIHLQGRYIGKDDPSFVQQVRVLNQNVNLTFDANGGTFASSGSSTLTLSNQTSYSLLSSVEIPSKEGSWFAGWKDSTGKDVSFPLIVPVANATYTANWSAIPVFSVTFNSNGGSAVATQYIQSGQRASTPQPPVMTNKRFVDWCTTPALTTPFDFETPITGNLTLYAQWRDEVTLTFNANGGTFFITGTDTLVFVNQTPGATVASIDTPTREGMWFAGWADASGNPVSFPLTVPSADATYTAQWNATPTYAVTFNSNGGSAIATQYVEAGSKATEPPAPTREQRIFGGWFSNTALTDRFDFNTPITEPITLYAKWNPIVVTLTFKAAGGTFASTGTDTLVLENQPVGQTLESVESPTKQGAWFNGWTDASGAKVGFPLTIPDTNSTYTATWGTSEIFVVLFNTNGGSSVSTRYVVGGNPVAKPQDPTKAHKRFGGWYSDPELSNLYDFSAPVTADLTLYAKWDPIVATLTFKAAGGTFASTGTDTLTLTNQVAGDAIAEVEVPTLADAWFEGWENIDGDAVPLPIIVPEVDTTYVADWSIYPTYAVHFDSNGGSAVGTQYILSGNLVERPTDPTKEGAEFAGWYSDAALQNRFNFATPITEETTLYAKWTPARVRVDLIFTANGGTFASTGTPVLYLDDMPAGDILTAVETPVKEGEWFAGWRDAKGNLVTFPLTIPDTDAIYTAVWEDTPGPTPPGPTPDPTPDSDGSGSSDTSLIPVTGETLRMGSTTMFASILALFGSLFAAAGCLYLARAQKNLGRASKDAE